MKNPMIALRRRINRLIEAKVEESWAGSQDPDLREIIEQEVKEAEKALDDVIEIIKQRLPTNHHPLTNSVARLYGTFNETEDKK